MIVNIYGGRRFPLQPSENQHLSNRDRMIDCVEVVFGSMTVASSSSYKRDLDENRIKLRGNMLKR